MIKTQKDNRSKNKRADMQWGWITPCFIIILIFFIILVLFLAWPSIATYWASNVEVTEKNGASKEQFMVMGNVHSSLGVLFSGLAFGGTFVVYYFTKQQVKYTKEQVEIERSKLIEEESRDKTIWYRQVIENVHHFYFKIEKPYQKGEILAKFAELKLALWDESKNCDDDILSLEKFFFEVKKAWYSTCCLYSNALTMISEDTKLSLSDKKELLKYLRAPFSPMDQVVMAIFYEAALGIDMPKHWHQKRYIMDDTIWSEFGSFEDWAKSSTKSHLPDNLIDPDSIYPEILEVLQSQNIYPTKDGNASFC